MASTRRRRGGGLWWVLGMVGLAMAGCLSEDTRRCDDGTVCGASQVCAPSGDRCAAPSLVAACTGLAEAAACQADFGDGVCLGGVCVSVACGNDRLEPGEVCDDGNNADRDGCARDCVSDETCGNGVRDAGEACDDGNLDDGDTCQHDCTLPTCGDGVLDVGEACDDGNLAGGDGCSADCRSDETCGNGTRDAGEACDDGNLADADGCQHDCALPTCGDGILDGNEACDDGNVTDADGCAGSCGSDETCGNHVVDYAAGEQCDDGNLVDHDGCQSTCVIQRCGDGFTDAPTEVCDDGNLDSGDGCAGDCRSDETCGNGRLDAAAAEQCDAGPFLSGDGCSSSCTVEVPTWGAVTPVDLAFDFARMVYAPLRQQLVLVGLRVHPTIAAQSTMETWAFDGSVWSPVVSATPMSARSKFALGADPTSGAVVLFGGRAVGYDQQFDDTWIFDDTGWHALSAAAPHPAARQECELTAAGSLGAVLLGGSSGFHPFITRNQETWTFRDGGWTKLATQGDPPPAYNLATTFDEQRGRVVLITSGATWEFDGVTWTFVTNTAPPFTEPVLTFDPDRGRTIAFSGWGPSNETWSYDGATWVQLSIAEAPPIRTAAVGAYLPPMHRIVVHGGRGFSTSLADTWQLGSAETAWSEVARDLPTLPTAIVVDSRRGRLVAVVREAAGYATWEASDAGWGRRDTATTMPLDNSGQGWLIYDSRRGLVVRLGATVLGGLDSIWEYDGVDWTLHHQAVAPPLRYEFGLALDDARGVIVVHGGRRSTAPGQEMLFGDTWEFDGTGWTQRASFTPRYGHTLAFVPASGRLVAFGGTTTIARATTTLVGNGGGWQEITTPHRPPWRVWASATTDPQRGTALVWAGYGGDTPGSSSPLDDLWEFDGGDWSPVVSLTVGPTSRTTASLTYDARRQRVLVGGGVEPGGVFPTSTWTLGWRNPASAPEACRDEGSDADGDGLAGCDDPDCWGRCAPTCPPAMSCPADAPTCGDGDCNAWLEDPALCPADCS